MPVNFRTKSILTYPIWVKDIHVKRIGSLKKKTIHEKEFLTLFKIHRKLFIETKAVSFNSHAVTTRSLRKTMTAKNTFEYFCFPFDGNLKHTVLYNMIKLNWISRRFALVSISCFFNGTHCKKKVKCWTMYKVKKINGNIVINVTTIQRSSFSIHFIFKR